MGRGLEDKSEMREEAAARILDQLLCHATGDLSGYAWRLFVQDDADRKLLIVPGFAPTQSTTEWPVGQGVTGTAFATGRGHFALGDEIAELYPVDPESIDGSGMSISEACPRHISRRFAAEELSTSLMSGSHLGPPSDLAQMWAIRRSSECGTSRLRTVDTAAAHWSRVGTLERCPVQLLRHCPARRPVVHRHCRPPHCLRLSAPRQKVNSGRRCWVGGIRGPASCSGCASASWQTLKDAGVGPEFVHVTWSSWRFGCNIREAPVLSHPLHRQRTWHKRQGLLHGTLDWVRFADGGRMTSPAQLEANKRNAQHSTGPSTGAGKSRSSQNAVRCWLHGTSARWPSVRPVRRQPNRAAGVHPGCLGRTGASDGAGAG